MQIQKSKRILAFVGAFGIIFFGSKILASNFSADILAADAPKITDFELPIVTEVGAEISVSGKNFGTDEDNLEIVLDGEDFPVAVSYGNQLKFELDAEMHSGELFLRKTIEGAGDAADEIVESAPLFLDLKTPEIAKMEAPDGLSPGAELTFSGKKLSAAEFWCDDDELEIKNQSAEKTTVKLPQKFLDCELAARQNGFKITVDDDFVAGSSVTVNQINFGDGKFKIYGKGFANFENNLDKLKLVFDSGATLSTATFVHDGEVDFAKTTTLLPNSGRVALEANGIISPQFTYSGAANFPKITNVFDLSTPTGETVIYQIGWTGSLDSRPGMKFKMNGSAVTLEGTKVESTTMPARTGTAWIELDGWKSAVFDYEFPETARPIIEKLEIGDHLNFEVSGKNFGSRENLLSVSTGAGDFEILNARNTSASLATFADEDEDTAKFVAPEGDFTLSIANKWGTSNAVNFTLPAAAGEIFFPEPEITGIEATNGLARGREIWVRGENLLNVASADFAGTSVATKILDSTKIAVTPPADIPLTGKLALVDRAGTRSAEIDYELFPTNQLRDITFEFPVAAAETALAQNDEWQNLFAFAVTNNQKTIELDPVEFAFDEKNILPFVDARLVDAAGTEIDGVAIELEQNEQKIILRGLEIPVAATKSVFTLQVKVFRELENAANFTFELGNIFEKDGAEIARENSTKKIAVAAAVAADAKWCREISGGEWQKCRTRVRRPSSAAAEI